MCLTHMILLAPSLMTLCSPYHIVLTLTPSLTVARPTPASDRTNYRPFQFVHPCRVVHPRLSRPVLGRPKHRRLCQAV